VCMCVGLGFYAILVIPKLFCVVICALAVSFIATCVLLTSRAYVCVRPGRLLCDL
jgi:hypothetical protein